MKFVISLALATCLVFEAIAEPVSNLRTSTVISQKTPERSPLEPSNRPQGDPNMPEVRLNQLVFEDNATIGAIVRFKTTRQLLAVNKSLVLTTPDSKDVEVLSLVPALEPMAYRSANEITIRFGKEAGTGKAMDGTLSATPGEFIMALYAYSPNGNLADTKSGRLAADYGFAAEASNDSALVKIDPGIDVDAKLGVGTLASSHGIVQIALDELLFHPSGPEQLQEFLRDTQGNVIRSSPGTEQGTPSWYAVRVKPKPVASKYLSQLRSVVGDKGVLGVGNQRTFDLYAYASELSLDGYRVALHPRLTISASLWTQDGGPGSLVDAVSLAGLSPGMASPVFGIRESWALLAMFDYDRVEPVRAAFLDVGFAPNPDFRGFPSLWERDMTDHGRLGPGAATGVPTVGAGLFGRKLWHGNGVVTTAGGVLNNNFGAAGTGGLVVSPRLYKYDLITYALDVGEGIRRAVDDEAEIINISAGYPCRLLWTLGPDNICSVLGREAFGVKVGLVFFGIAAIICATLGWIPFAGEVICAAALIVAADLTAWVLLLFPFLGDLRGAMEEAVNYAALRGVPVVSTAGNRIRAANLGAFARFVDVSNSSDDDWQVIPGVIPPVINCGAAAATFPFANREFYGSVVDIWAPIASRFWGPPTLDSVDGGQVEQLVCPTCLDGSGLGGTSAAAPYVTGILSNMMAVNGSLRRGTARGPEVPNIVPNITNMLVSTATAPGTSFGSVLLTVPVSADPLVAPVDRLEVGRRRNMVNAFQALRQAAGTDILNYESLGYDSDLGLVTAAGPGDDGADTSSEALDVHGHFLSSDDFRLESHGLAEENFIDEIAYIRPSPPFARSTTDEDWYLWKTPAAPGVYVATVTLTIPSVEATGSILVNGVPGTFTSDNGVEKTFTFVTPLLFEAAAYRFRVHGVADADSLYKLRIGPATISPDAPMADPHETGAGDDVMEHATVLGSGGAGWPGVRSEDPTKIHEATAFEVDSSGHTIHSRDDVDWFRLEAPPMMPENCEGCPPTLKISIEPPNANASIEIRAADGRLITSGPANRPLTLGCNEYRERFPIFVRVASVGSSPSNYTLRARWSIPSATFCLAMARIRSAHEGPAPGGGRGDRNSPSDPLDTLWGSRYFDPYEIIGEAGRPRPADSSGRVMSPSLYLMDWSGGDFKLRVLGGTGQSLRLQIYALDGKLRGQAGTPDVFKEADQRTGPRVGGGMVATDLAVRGLAAGQYILALSLMRQGDQLMVFLPQGAVHDGTPGLENFLKPSQAKAWQLGAYQDRQRQPGK